MTDSTTEQQTSVSPRYKDCVAKRCGLSLREALSPEFDSGSHPLRPGDLARKGPLSCGAYMQEGMCSSGTRYVKYVRCGREWCPTCGRDDSEYHRRRLARWMDKLRQFSSMGYLVIEWPLEARGGLRSVTALRQSWARVKRVLRAHGYVRGLGRWHWFGDPRCPAGCCPTGTRNLPVERDDGSLWCPVCGLVFAMAEARVRWNPHLNVLIDGGYLEDLEALKRALREALGEPALIVNYGYVDEPARILHRARYVLRSTFRAWEWAPEMADMLTGFHTTLWWGAGQWDKPPVWDLDSEAGAEETPALEVQLLEHGVCPCCQGRLRWHGVTATRRVVGWYEIEWLGGGYGRLRRRAELVRLRGRDAMVLGVLPMRKS